MAAALMAHQTEGIEFLMDAKAGLLAFEQGLGKTLVAIDAFRRLRLSEKAGRLLVLCPNSLKRNWVAEIQKFAPELSVEIAEGTPRERRRIFSGSKADAVITSYETARSEVTALLALVKRQKTALVLDESHAAKNEASLTSAAARHIAPHCEYRWLLSGTPVTNTPSDLYTQIGILEPARNPLGSRESFLATIEDDPEAGYVRETLGQLILRRTKEQCLDLPEKTFFDVRIELPPWQRKLYDDMRERMLCEIKAMNGDQYRAFASTALAQLTRLTQIASNPKLLFPELEKVPAKFESLDGLIADILSMPSRKVIIWSNYVQSIETLIERLGKYGTAALYGAVPADERQEIARRFQNDEKTRVLIANPAAAGTGFTLTAAAYTIYETLSWRYDHYAQSQDRNHRIGQANPVTYMRLIAADTIEDAIAKALERKLSLASNLLSDAGGRSPVSRLSQEEMYELLMNNRLPS